MDGFSVEALVEELFDAHRARIFAICLARLGNAADAEDAVQETFARLPRALRVRAAEEAPAWLTVVAINVCRRELRRRRSSTTALAAAEPERALDDLVVDRMVLRAVWGRLSARERLMLLHRYQGHSYQEISRSLGYTVDSAMVLSARARARARELRRQLVAALTGLVPGRLRGARRPAAEVWGGPIATMPLLAATATCLVLGSVTGGGTRAIAPAQPVAQTAALAYAPAATVAPETSPMAPPALTRTTPSHDARPESQASPQPPQLPPSLPVEPGAGATSQVPLPYLTQSPAYATDGTLFASTRAQRLDTHDLNQDVAVVFKSVDRGSTWTRLGSNGFGGGRIMLSPRYPVEGVLLAADGNGLQRSDDGGLTFHYVFPLAEHTSVSQAPPPAAVDPASPPGDLRVILGLDPLLVYHADLGIVTPGPTLPVNTKQIFDIAYIGASGNLMATVNDPTGLDFSAIRCDATSCATVIDAGGTFLERIIVSPDFTRDQRVAVIAYTDVFSSADGGVVFKDLPLGNQLAVPAGAFSTTRGRVDGFWLGGAAHQSAFAHLGLDGRLTVLATAADMSLWFGDVVQTQDSHLLASSNGAFAGLRCSADGGLTWSTAC